jgi:hypothetical protein
MLCRTLHDINKLMDSLEEQEYTFTVVVTRQSQEPLLELNLGCGGDMSPTNLLHGDH